MHDDLIDAVDWAVGQGIADPKRVGFFGASYGGYSALTAATKTPEVFACIVDIFGISNLITFMATIPPYWGPWFSIWKNRLGDPATEAGRAFLTERSPLTHIDRAVRPILIAQGMQDVRVVAAESEQMVAALKKRGVPVTYITFADEGHGFARPENRIAFYAVTESFLAKHLGGRSQPVGDDFEGSSLKVETGGELVPGLGVEGGSPRLRCVGAGRRGRRTMSHERSSPSDPVSQSFPRRRRLLARPFSSRLAQGKMCAAERHRGTKAQRGKPGQHAGNGGDRTWRGSGLAGAGQHQHADRDQELAHPLRDLSGHRALHQGRREIAADERRRRDQPPRYCSARGHEFAGVGPPQPAEIEAVARAQHVHGERQQHAGDQGRGEDEAAWEIGGLGHGPL